MSDANRRCPDCDDASSDGLSRREFLLSASALAAVAAGSGTFGALRNHAVAAAPAAAKVVEVAAPETTVKRLYDALSEAQRKEVCFDWDYQHPQRGLLRTFVANNWTITRQEVNGKFYTPEQRKMIREVFEGIVQPDWHARIDKQLKDDAGGFGQHQAIAIFGKPGQDKFEFVLTGRHMTLRCDGKSNEHAAFGGPIFYGHAAQGFNEPSDHPHNVFWPQAQMANTLYGMLDGRHRKLALVSQSPAENAVGFRGPEGKFPGVPVADFTADQKAHLQKVLEKLVEPYRQSDRDGVAKCLAAQGGLDKCSLAFYQDNDIGNDGVWDNWRLEGPSFVWYFRGTPHVHVWVNVADDPKVKLNA